jgi:hypothetical protein
MSINHLIIYNFYLILIILLNIVLFKNYLVHGYKKCAQQIGVGQREAGIIV